MDKNYHVGTKAKIFKDMNELNDFLKNHKVISVSFSIPGSYEPYTLVWYYE